MIFVIGLSLSVLFFIIFSYVISPYARRILLFFPVAFYSIFIAFQGSSGSDTFEYVRVYNNATDYLSFIFFEPAFYFYFSGLRYFDLSYEFVNYSHAFVVALSLYLIAVKRSPLLAALYVVYIGINVDFSTLRQSFGLHVFSIFYLMSERFYLSVISSTLFHFSGIFALVLKVSNINITIKYIIILIFISVPFYFYINRYLSNGMSFLIRDDFGFILQTLIILFLCYFMGYSKRILVIIAIISVIPIGYRMVFFLLIVPHVNLTKVAANKVVVCCVLMLFLFFKLNSFVIQSVSNDGENSIVTHYERMFF